MTLICSICSPVLGSIVHKSVHVFLLCRAALTLAGLLLHLPPTALLICDASPASPDDLQRRVLWVISCFTWDEGMMKESLFCLGGFFLFQTTRFTPSVSVCRAWNGRWANSRLWLIHRELLRICLNWGLSSASIKQHEQKTPKRFSDLKKQGFCDQLVNIFPSSYATLLRFLCYVIPALLSNCINQGFIMSPHSEAIHSSDRMLQMCHLLQSHLGKQLWHDLRYGELLFNVSA